MCNTVIIGKGKVPGTTVPTSVQTFDSKFERNIGDRIRFNGEEWKVISCGFNSKQDAIDTQKEMVQIFKQKGYWSGSVTRRKQF